MLTSRRAFAGDSVSDTLASVIKSDPDWSRLPAATPAGVRRLLKRSLEKNVTQRLQAIGDARLEIDDALAGREPDAPRTIYAPPARGFRRPVPLALALALALAAVVTGSIVASWLSRGSGTEANQRPLEVTQTLISVAPADRLRSTTERVESLGEGRPNRTAVALSPDGRSLVFSAVRGKQLQLYLRELDQLDATPIVGTEGGGGPFFSPDGQWVGFWANGALKKVTRKGGAGATTICETTETRLAMVGASWGSNNTIVFAGQSGRLWQVSAAGGQPSPLTRLDESKGERSHRLPQILPGSGAVLFTVRQTAFPKWEETRVVVQSLVTGERKDLLQGADARYVPSGHLVYVRAGALFAVAFDLERLQVTSGPVNMLGDVMQAAYMPNGFNNSGAGQFAVSASGALVYVPGGMFPDLERSLVWVDRKGATQLVLAERRAYFAPRLSPDGQRVLVWISGRDRNVWVYNIPRGSLTKLTTEGQNAYSQWTPNGMQVTFQNAVGTLLWKPVDGAGTEARLTTEGDTGLPSSWSPDGQALAIVRATPETDYDIWVLPLTGDRKPHPVVKTTVRDMYPEFSPDGQWLAYSSSETGRDEVYVQRYPGPGPRYQVSSDGGIAPAWPRHGRELFYQARSEGSSEATERRKFIAVPVTTTGQTFVAGKPRVLFEFTYPRTDLPVRRVRRDSGWPAVPGGAGGSPAHQSNGDDPRAELGRGVEEASADEVATSDW